MAPGVRAPTGGRRHRLAALATAVLALAAGFAPVFVLGPEAGAQTTAKPGFRPVAQIPLAGQNFSGSNTLFVDSTHRRAYVMEKVGDGFELRRFNLDAVSNQRLGEGAPLRVTSAEFPSVQRPRELLAETVSVYDEERQRLIWSGGDGIYELRIPEHNPATDAGVHRWVISGRVGSGDTSTPSGIVNNAVNNTSLDTVIGSALFIQGLSYEPKGPGGKPLLYFVAETVSVEGRGMVVLGAMNATPSTVKLPAEEERLEWLYPVSACVNLDRTGAKLQSLITRAGPWLYTYCSGSEDGSARGVVRVKVGLGGPDQSSEQFYPGVTGTIVHAAADPAEERLYFSTTNNSAGARNVLVFDGAVGQGTASVSSLGAYVGEVALTQQIWPTREAMDVASGRWYFQSADALWYQDGRLRRVAQAVRYKTDLEGTGLAQSSNANWHRLFVDRSAPGRNARVFVYRHAGETTERNGVTLNRCPDATKPCFDVYEDTNPYPGPPPPPDERTLNEPEGDGRVGVYSGVTSAYGMKVRLVRGLSSFWPNGVGFVSLEGDRKSPPEALGDYLTDPFFEHGGDCGSRDRELTFGRVLQTQLTGGLFDRGGQASALAVDPDVHRPSASDDTMTREDFQDPDSCVRHFFRVFTKAPATNFGFDEADCKYTDEPDFDPDRHTACRADMPGDLSPLGRPWPYVTTSCSGDEDPGAVKGSFEGPGSDRGPLVGTADVRCAATTDKPTVEASTRFHLEPGGASPVTVQDISVTTSMERVPGKGVASTATSIVKGVSVLGLVEIEQIRVTATSAAAGYATADASTAKVTTKREFLGMSVLGQRRCDVCDPKDVVAAINEVLGGFGYARAASAESDFTRGTSKGTLAIVQKDLVLQDADATSNRDFGTEWPGLEIVIYRDGAQRGLGRWHIQLGGVFTQSQFGVVNELAPLVLDDLPFDVDLEPLLPTEAFFTEAVAPTAPERFLVAVAGAEEVASTSPAAVAGAEPGILKQIRQGLVRSLGAAVLLAGLWVLVYGPIHVGRRRSLLKQVASA